MLGGELKIDALDGEVEVEIPKGAKPGEKVRINGRGVPSLRGGRRGDLYYVLNPDFPNKLSSEEDALLRQLAEVRKVKVDSGKKGFFGRKK